MGRALEGVDERLVYIN